MFISSIHYISFISLHYTHITVLLSEYLNTVTLLQQVTHILFAVALLHYAFLCNCVFFVCACCLLYIRAWSHIIVAIQFALHINCDCCVLLYFSVYVCAVLRLQVRMTFDIFVFVFLCISFSNMEKQSVVATGLLDTSSYEDTVSFFKAVGAVDKVVRVIGPGMKFTGKAYVVYKTPDSATTAIQRLTFGDVKVEAVTEMEEFKSLVGEVEEDEQVSFMQQWQKFSKPQQAMFRKMMGMETPHTPASAASFFGETPVVVQEKPSMPSFSGSGKDCSFGRWKHEAECLDADEKYSDSTVLEAVRKSLKTPAADVMPHLGVGATLQQLIDKIASIYGSVLSGEALLEKFYCDQQAEGETCAKWSMRLEDSIYQAAQKGALAMDSVRKSLKQKFWSGLRDQNIKNALRHRYQDLDFEHVLAEARAIEEENSPIQKEKAKSHQVSGSEDSKFDLLLKKMDKMETEIKELKEDKKKTAEVKRKVQCGKCNLEGHLTWGCRKDDDVTCHRCHQKGHISRSCRNKKALNKQ